VLFKELGKSELTMTLQEFIGHFLDENGNPTTKSLHEMRAKFETPTSQLYKMSDLYGSGSLEWYIMNTVPVHDKEGRVNGQFGLIRNVTSLINAQEQLKRETERANDSGRLKSVFMANMTHEIRTPLNSIVGFTDLLPIITSPDDKREMIQVIKNNCDMLLRLINDILEISSMDSKEIKLEPEQVDFSQVFNRIYQGLKERVQNPSVEFLCDNPYDSCPAYLDAQRINQILTNFVTNAVKYTHQGHIKIGYSKQQDGLYIYCEDTGTGIPKEKQGKIFERFVKLNDYVQGTGLGLSICKAITDRSGGQIGVESEGDNQGSKFWVWIPLNTSIQDNE
jgi:signal transduction histidine kinase